MDWETGALWSSRACKGGCDISRMALTSASLRLIQTRSANQRHGDITGTCDGFSTAQRWGTEVDTDYRPPAYRVGSPDSAQITAVRMAVAIAITAIPAIR